MFEIKETKNTMENDFGCHGKLRGKNEKEKYSEENNIIFFLSFSLGCIGNPKILRK